MTELPVTPFSLSSYAIKIKTDIPELEATMFYEGLANRVPKTNIGGCALRHGASNLIGDHFCARAVLSGWGESGGTEEPQRIAKSAHLCITSSCISHPYE